jgi:hypothetical protein
MIDGFNTLTALVELPGPGGEAIQHFTDDNNVGDPTIGAVFALGCLMAAKVVERTRSRGNDTAAQQLQEGETP